VRPYTWLIELYSVILVKLDSLPANTKMQGIDRFVDGQSVISLFLCGPLVLWLCQIEYTLALTRRLCSSNTCNLLDDCVPQIRVTYWGVARRPQVCHESPSNARVLFGLPIHWYWKGFEFKYSVFDFESFEIATTQFVKKSNEENTMLVYDQHTANPPNPLRMYTRGAHKVAQVPDWIKWHSHRTHEYGFKSATQSNKTKHTERWIKERHDWEKPTHTSQDRQDRRHWDRQECGVVNHTSRAPITLPGCISSCAQVHMQMRQVLTTNRSTCASGDEDLAVRSITSTVALVC